MNPSNLKRRRLARFCYVLAILSLASGLLAGSTSRDPGVKVLCVLAGVAGYVLDSRRATVLSFGSKTRERSWAPGAPAYRVAAEGVAPILTLAAHQRRDAHGTSPRSPRPRWP